MSTATEPVSRRLGYLRHFDPLLGNLVELGMLSDGDADLVIVAAQATERRRGARLVVPGGSSDLAGYLALDLAVRRVLDPHRYGTNPIAIVTSAPWRKLHALADVASQVIANGLGAVRLRNDGQVQELHGSRTRPLVDADRLVFVTPRVRWPDLDVALATVVVDAAALGDALDDALSWAKSNSQVVHVVATLDPNAEPSGAEVDWPSVLAEPERWGRHQAWPSVGVLQIESAGRAPDGLEEARNEIADAAKGDRPWPPQLVAAAGLSRALATVAVPLSLYDAYTARTIAPSFADRVEVLEKVRPGDFPSAWHGFAETAWPALKRRLLDAAASLEADNPKAAAVGLAVERLLAAEAAVTIWTPSVVHGRAIETHLLTAGFAVTPEDFETGRITVDVLKTNRPAERRRSASLLTGLPTSWQLPAVFADILGGPLVVLAYDFESAPMSGYFGWLLNARRLERHAERIQLFEAALGSGVEFGPPPRGAELTVERHDHEDVSVTGPTELGDDSAELAALANDEWLAVAVQRREQAGGGHLGNTLRPALAFLVEPGPAVLLVAEHSFVDRLVAGRLRPTPAAALTPGMTILGSSSGGETIFDRVRPHLDRLRGVGTRFWMDRWDDALVDALQATGGRAGLARALVDAGASITSAAVGAWPSPYRIGPRDEDNVERVARIGQNVYVARNAGRVQLVMRGVRIEHRKLGRLLAAAVRRHLSGDAEAFDQVEELLGVPIEELLGEVSVSTVTAYLGRGRAPGSTLGRIHLPATAQRIFVPEEATS